MDKLIPIYFSKSHIDNLTFHELFAEWLDYKSSVTNSPNTIKRHTQHYNKYFAVSVLDNMKAAEIDELLLEQECNRIIRKFNLSRKEWCNAKTILNGMYAYAVRKKYLTENPLTNVQILVKFKQVVKKTGKTEIYNTRRPAFTLFWIACIPRLPIPLIWQSDKRNGFLLMCELAKIGESLCYGKDGNTIIKI